MMILLLKKNIVAALLLKPLRAESHLTHQIKMRRILNARSLEIFWLFGFVSETQAKNVHFEMKDYS